MTQLPIEFLAAGPGKFDDWVQIAIFAVIVLGSVISGLINAARKTFAKAKAQRESLRGHIADAYREEGEPETPFPASEYRPPVARPMPPRRPAVLVESRPSVVPTTSARNFMPAVTLERTQPPRPPNPTGMPGMAGALVDMLRERVEAAARKAANKERGQSRERQIAPSRVDSRRPPQRTRAAPARAAQGSTSASPKGELSASFRGLRQSDEIAKREDSQTQMLEKRIGHVETHVAAAHTDELDHVTREEIRFDRAGLRRAMIMREILGGPVGW